MTVVELFAIVGVLTTVVAGLAVGYYVYSRRPTPNASLREAVTSINWPFALCFFVGLPIVGVIDEGSGAVLGAVVLGGCMVCFVVLMQWWFGPL